MVLQHLLAKFSGTAFAFLLVSQHLRPATTLLYILITDSLSRQFLLLGYIYCRSENIQGRAECSSRTIQFAGIRLFVCD